MYAKQAKIDALSAENKQLREQMEAHHELVKNLEAEVKMYQSLYRNTEGHLDFKYEENKRLKSENDNLHREINWWHDNYVFGRVME
jgi:hypothetical protein